MKECNLKSIKFPRSMEYSSGSVNEPMCFYLDALSNSNHFDLLLGYFSSSAINVLAIGFTKFLLNGGTMRMVINQFLRKEDKAMIMDGQTMSPSDFYEHELSIKELRKNLNETGEHFFNCIAWLIAKERIKIEIVKPKDGTGIAHYKSGIFSDGINKVQFKGSCNFTAKALTENLEEIGIKVSWQEKDNFAITENQTRFNSYFDHESDQVEYLNIENVKEIILDEFSCKNIDELVNDEAKLIRKKKSIFENSKQAKQKVNEIEKELNEYENQPRFPYESGPRDYQKQAYKNWVANNRKGIFAMATGTGKTIISLNCLLEEYKLSELFQALILVPTNDLQKQWIKEVNKFNIIQSIIVVGIDANWKRKLSKLTTALSFGSEKSFVIISTYASFTRNALQHFVQYLPKKTLLIADEAHNIASPKVKEILPTISFEKRIGLSATPKRIYDAEGTDAMNLFFNDSPPYTYEFSMEEAIAKGILCQYEYYPHIVELSQEELDEYKEVTLRLIRFFDPDTKSFSNSDAVTQLLMRRKRIIHKAQNKLPHFKGIIRKELKKRGNLKYTFVYVPEGLDRNSEEEERVIMYYNQAVMEAGKNLRISSFTGETDDREATLNAFERGEIDVLTAMKCLDEGVDVPRTELAIFCSSTANPRQFIQRRGRILRQHDDKMYAVIHDLVVVPRLDLSIERSETFNMERSQVENELKRVADFAFMARNQIDAIQKIQPICNYYDLDLLTIKEQMD